MGRIWVLGGGGGADLDVITAGSKDLRAGKVIVDKDGNPLTGTLPDRGSWGATGLAAGASVTIPAGIHDGTGRVIAKPLADQTPGNLAAGNMLSGAYGYSNGVRVNGGIASMGAQSVAPGAAVQKVSCRGKYMTGDVTVQAVAGLTAANIKKGVTVGGVTGTWEGYVANPTDLYYKGSNPAGFYVSDNGNGFGSASFDGVYITATSTTTSANGVTITAGRTYNLSGYSRLVIELNVIKAPPYYNSNGGLFFKNGSEELGRLWQDGLYGTIGQKTYSFDLSNVQKVVTPSLDFTLRTATVQITRIRLE